jgi:hypothetical protein
MVERNVPGSHPLGVGITSASEKKAEYRCSRLLYNNIKSTGFVVCLLRMRRAFSRI